MCVSYEHLKKVNVQMLSVQCITVYVLNMHIDHYTPTDLEVNDDCKSNAVFISKSWSSFPSGAAAFLPSVCFHLCPTQSMIIPVVFPQKSFLHCCSWRPKHCKGFRRFSLFLLCIVAIESKIIRAAAILIINRSNIFFN